MRRIIVIINILITRLDWTRMIDNCLSKFSRHLASSSFALWKILILTEKMPLLVLVISIFINDNFLSRTFTKRFSFIVNFLACKLVFFEITTLRVHWQIIYRLSSTCVRFYGCRVEYLQYKTSSSWTSFSDVLTCFCTFCFSSIHWACVCVTIFAYRQTFCLFIKFSSFGFL